MAAVVTAVHGHQVHANGRRDGDAGTGLKTMSPFGVSSAEGDAALTIQRAAFPRLIAPDRTGARVLPVPPTCKNALPAASVSIGPQRERVQWQS